jgi:hypothetical protein
MMLVVPATKLISLLDTQQLMEIRQAAEQLIVQPAVEGEKA